MSDIIPRQAKQNKDFLVSDNVLGTTAQIFSVEKNTLPTTVQVLENSAIYKWNFQKLKHSTKALIKLLLK